MGRCSWVVLVLAAMIMTHECALPLSAVPALQQRHALEQEDVDTADKTQSFKTVEYGKDNTTASSSKKKGGTVTVIMTGLVWGIAGALVMYVINQIVIDSSQQVKNHNDIGGEYGGIGGEFKPVAIAFAIFFTIGVVYRGRQQARHKDTVCDTSGCQDNEQNEKKSKREQAATSYTFNAIYAGTAPTIEDDEHDEYDDLMVGVPIDPKEKERELTQKEAPSATIRPLEVNYELDRPLLTYVTKSKMAATGWQRAMFPTVELTSALTFEMNAEVPNGRYLTSAYCELTPAGGLTERVVAWQNGGGQVWGGDYFYDRLESPFVVSFRDVSPSQMETMKDTDVAFKTSLNAKPQSDRDNGLIEFGKRLNSKKTKKHELYNQITKGDTRPGDPLHTAATFGIYYAESDIAMALHGTWTDLASAYSIVVVPKTDTQLRLLPDYALGFDSSTTTNDQCRAIAHMEILARCFYQVNQEWFLKKYEVPEEEWTEAWSLLYGSLQIGFRGNYTDSGWLTMHALLGGPTSEGLHPSFVNEWISVTALLDYLGCSVDQVAEVGQRLQIDSIDECPGITDDGDTSKTRLACGAQKDPSSSSITGGITLYPMEAAAIANCPKHYQGTDAVYLAMNAFDNKAREGIIADVNRGPDKWEKKDWQTAEKASGVFIGAVEQRSKPVKYLTWSDTNTDSAAAADEEG